MRHLLICCLVGSLFAAALPAQEGAVEQARTLLDRVAKRPDRAWDYSFALRRMATGDDLSKLLGLFEQSLEHESEHVRMVCARLVASLGEPGPALETVIELLESEDSAVVEACAMMLLQEGIDDEDMLQSLRDRWENSDDLAPGARVALCEALYVNARDALALEQLREFLSSSDHELVSRAALVLSERGHAREVEQRVSTMAREPGDMGRLARIGQEVVKIDQATQDYKSGRAKRKEKFIEVQLRALKQHYVDDQFIYNNKPQAMNNENLVDQACRAMALASDRYGSFLTRAEIDEMQQDQSGTYVGIGAHVSQGTDGAIVVDQPIYEGPAYKAGVRSGDRLVGINGPDGKRIDLTAKTLEEGVELVRGPEGSIATVYIKRRNTEKELVFEITRKPVHVDTALEEMLPGNVGYVRLTRFGNNSGKDMKESLVNLRRLGMKSLILDLRGNPGGSLTAVIDIASMLLPKGKPIASAGGVFGEWKGKKGPFLSDGGEFTEVPLVVLIDEDSASGSEMLSGALKDNDRATVIGRATFGKGIGQSFFSVDGTGGRRVLKCTVFNYFLPSGITIDRFEGVGGVSPHIEMGAEYLEPWQVYAVDKLRKSGVIDDYLDKHYTGEMKVVMSRLAVFDGLDSAAWPEFENWYTALKTPLARDDVRREIRYALRRRVQDDRGAEFTQNFQEDKVLLRGVKELFIKLKQDPMTVGEYAKVLK